MKIEIEKTDLKTMFAKASKSFIEANPATLTHPEDKNELQTPRRRGKGRSMNQAEAEFAAILEAMRRNSEIESWKFEGVTLRLADGCRYTPDFFVVLGRRLRFCEVKGTHIWEDSMVKFKVARQQNPWAEWQLHQKTKNGWQQIL